MSNLFGWVGKILRIDLTERKIVVTPTSDYNERFLGGIGVGEKIYWDESSPNLEAFHPENPLVFMTGPLAVTQTPSASRIAVCGKSPCIYPETFVRASMGGFFAAELKQSGYDGIVVKGRADRPVYVNIENNRVEIRDASHLWGLTNSNTHDIIQKKLGGRLRILSIGPGGENGSRIGIVYGDAASCASFGYGSVMGSKNLKAIAVRGSGTIPVAEPDRVELLRNRFMAMIGEGFYPLRGVPLALPGGDVEVVRKVHCHSCPQGCWRSLQRTPTGEEGIRKCQTGIFYASWDMKLHGNITEASFLAGTLVNEYSLCALEVQFLLMWLETCFERGILSEKDTELPLLEMGSIEFLEKMIRKICFREGFGAVLSEGALRASEICGEKSREITRDILTQAGYAVPYGPKIFVQSSLIFATEARPYITELHEIRETATKWAMWFISKGEKLYVSTEVLRKIAGRFWGSERAVDFSTYEGKALAAVKVQNRQIIKESLILCDLAWPVFDDASTEDHVGDSSLESQFLSAVTGWEIDEKGLEKIGERIFALNRAILLREGRRGREDDYMPESQFIEREEPIGDLFGMNNPELFLPGKGDVIISRKGKAVDREKFEQLKDEYYELRGWDVPTGLLRKNTLKELGLEDIIESLAGKVI
jgi:aldehyde:ferredoxin oxidoreductase